MILTVGFASSLSCYSSLPHPHLNQDQHPVIPHYNISIFAHMSSDLYLYPLIVISFSLSGLSTLCFSFASTTINLEKQIFIVLICMVFRVPICWAGNIFCIKISLFSSSSYLEGHWTNSHLFELESLVEWYYQLWIQHELTHYPSASQFPVTFWLAVYFIEDLLFLLYDGSIVLNVLQVEQPYLYVTPDY